MCHGRFQARSLSAFLRGASAAKWINIRRDVWQTRNIFSRLWCLMALAAAIWNPGAGVDQIRGSQRWGNDITNTHACTPNTHAECSSELQISSWWQTPNLSNWVLHLFASLFTSQRCLIPKALITSLINKKKEWKLQTHNLNSSASVLCQQRFEAHKGMDMKQISSRVN